MGNLAQPLLQALGSVAGGQQPDPLAAYRQDANSDAPNPMSAIIAGMGGGNEGGALPPGTIQENDSGGMTPEVQAVVQGFKPKRVSFWGALGDQLLQHWGQKPHFEPGVDQKNLRHAMEGFTQDPLEAIRRIAQVPGHEEDAWKLLNEYQDNQRASATLDRQNRQLDLTNDAYIYNQTAAMMGAVPPDGSTWSQMRDLAIKRAQARGVDVSYLIPEQFDPTAIEYIRFGAVKPKDQMQIEQKDRSLDITEKNVDSQIGHRQVQEQQGERRLDQADTAEQGRNYRHDNPVATPKAPAQPKYETKDIRDSRGGIRRVIIDRKNGKAYSKLPDGRTIIYGVDGNKLKPIGVE